MTTKTIFVNIISSSYIKYVQEHDKIEDISSSIQSIKFNDKVYEMYIQCMNTGKGIIKLENELLKVLYNEDDILKLLKEICKTNGYKMKKFKYNSIDDLIKQFFDEYQIYGYNDQNKNLQEYLPFVLDLVANMYVSFMFHHFENANNFNSFLMFIMFTFVNESRKNFMNQLIYLPKINSFIRPHGIFIKDFIDMHFKNNYYLKIMFLANSSSMDNFMNTFKKEYDIEKCKNIIYKLLIESRKELYNDIHKLRID